MMTEEQVAQAKDIAELKVRQYFDTYLGSTLPMQISQFINAHDKDPASHGGVEKRFNRMIWLMMGSAAAGGTAATGMMKLIAMLGS